MPVGGSVQTRLEGSAWGLCMAAVRQLWSTMPVVNGTRAAGWEALLGVDWRDPAALAAAVRKLLAPALAKSPLFWHKVFTAYLPKGTLICSIRDALPRRASAALSCP